MDLEKQSTKREVKFIDEVNMNGMKISVETFIYQIDKFLSIEPNFVCIPYDLEYDEFLKKEKLE